MHHCGSSTTADLGGNLQSSLSYVIPRTTGLHDNLHAVKKYPASHRGSLSVKTLYIHDSGRGKGIRKVIDNNADAVLSMEEPFHHSCCLLQSFPSFLLTLAFPPESV